MADDLGAVRRTPRPTGDRQTPETVAQPVAGTTQDVPEGKEANPGGPVRERLAELVEVLRGADTARWGGPQVTFEGMDVPYDHFADAIINAGWRPPREDPGALAELRAKLAEDPDSILFPGPECDMEAYAALPPCTACEGGGQDTHGTVFEAPLAVHFAGPPCDVGQRKRQLCMWCGHVLIDAGTDAKEWPVGTLIRIEDGVGQVEVYGGEPFPPGCCALPDDEPAVAEPARAYLDDAEHDDIWPRWCKFVFLGKRCTFAPGHQELWHRLPDGTEVNNEGEPMADEAQETRAAADWPAEPVDTPAEGDHV